MVENNLGPRIGRLAKLSLIVRVLPCELRTIIGSEIAHLWELEPVARTHYPGARFLFLYSGHSTFERCWGRETYSGFSLGRRRREGSRYSRKRVHRCAS